MYASAQTLYQKPHADTKGSKVIRGGRPGVLVPSALVGPAGAVAERVLHPPRILPAGGDAGRGQVVVIENHPLNAECAIFYTTDGTEPTIHSKCYETPFQIHPPERPQIAVRAVAAAAVTRFSAPASEVFSFDPAAAEPTPAPAWHILDGPVIDIIAPKGATVYFKVTPYVDPLHREGYLFQGPFRLLPPAETSFELTAVAVLPNRPPSKPVAATVKVPASVLHAGTAVAGPQLLTPRAVPPTPPPAGRPSLPGAAGVDGGTNTTPAVFGAPQSLLPAPQILVCESDGPPRSVVLTLNDKPTGVMRTGSQAALFSTPGPGAVGTGQVLRAFYAFNDGAWCDWPESDYLSIPLDPPHEFMRKYAVTYAFATPTDLHPHGCGVSYVCVPAAPPAGRVSVPATPRTQPPPTPAPPPPRVDVRRVREEGRYMFQQALKWLWEVVSRVQAVHDQWSYQSYATEKQELILCTAKLESAVLLSLVNLSADTATPAQYSPPDARAKEGEAIQKRHFQEASDAALSLYHVLLSAQRSDPADPATDALLPEILALLKGVMGKLRVLLELLPDTPGTAPGAGVPQWLENARGVITKSDGDAGDGAVIKDGRTVVAHCRNHAGEMPEHAGAVGQCVERLCARLEASGVEKERLNAELHQARVDADELRNKIDELVAAVQAGRIREGKLEARVEELRRCVHDHAPPAAGASAHASAAGQIGYTASDSHVAFLLNPDS